MLSEIPQIVTAIALSLFSGIGVYLHERRNGRITGGATDFLTEVSIAITAGLIALYIGRYERWDDAIIYLSILVASNNGAEIMGALKQRILMLVSTIGNTKGK